MFIHVKEGKEGRKVKKKERTNQNEESMDRYIRKHGGKKK